MGSSIRSRRVDRAAIPLLLAALFSVALAVPSYAAASDFDSRTDVACKYRITEGSGETWSEAKLRRFIIGGPFVYGKREGPHTVGWRYRVERSYSNGPWQTTYKSSIQKSTATLVDPAQFYQRSIGVTLPEVENPVRLSYRIVIKVFWYLSDGSVGSTASDLIEEYDWFLNGEDQYTSGPGEWCPGTQRQFVDGPGG